MPIWSKIVEGILADRLLYIEAYNIIPKHQFGFRKNHSTIQQIHRVVNKMYTDFDNKRFCVSIFIDVAKAFDKVWHVGLLHKLKFILPKNFLNTGKLFGSKEILC